MKPYPHYKDSGIAWLWQIPEHWEAFPLKFSVKFLNNKRIPLSSEERGAMTTKTYPYYGASGIIDYVESYIFDKPLILIAEDGANLLSRSTPLAFIADGRYWVNNHAHILEPILGPFEYWANLLCEIDYSPWISGSAQPKLTKERLGNIKLPVPPANEQQAIARFLDEKTKQIDDLIAQKERLLQLLAEKRTALITRAVTRGLNPNAPTKDSGIPWLGKIPAHWDILDFRRGISFLTDFEANGSFSSIKDNLELDKDDKYAWYVRATDLENNRIGIVDGNRSCTEHSYNFLGKTSLYGNELLVAKRGEIGKVYVLPEIDCKATLAPNLYLIRLNDKLIPKYVYYWFTSRYGKPQLTLANLSTTIGAIYKDDIKKCLVIFPPKSEQREISKYLNSECESIDEIITHVENSIDKLKEYRSSLITHAVTGKIDVRPTRPEKYAHQTVAL
jgi:type I restriction enzyme, S subunit